MKKTFKKITKYFFARPSIELARIWPLHLNISVMRRLNEIQLSAEQLKVIVITVKAKAPCKLLIFGLGNDSVFWLKLNRGGVTIFLENNNDWFQKITKRSKDLIVFLVNYNTQRNDWKLLLESPSLLDMTLPNNVAKEEWDVIFVDAPEGWNDQTSGRMKSIYLSSKLVKNSGDIFVHDCNREVEDIYCNKFLKKENLKKEIKAPSGFLRHYHITNRST
jgi:glucuronoxylan 4-O-methyltransferase